MFSTHKKILPGKNCAFFLKIKIESSSYEVQPRHGMADREMYGDISPFRQALFYGRRFFIILL